MQRFRSKLGWVFIAPAVILAGLAAANISYAVSTGSLARALVPSLPVLAFVWVFLTTDYTVTDTDLRVRCAFSTRSIPLASIRYLRPTRNPLSAPALSLDRIEIGLEGGIALVSPRDRAGFVRAIVERAPAVEVQGIIQP